MLLLSVLLFSSICTACTPSEAVGCLNGQAFDTEVKFACRSKLTTLFNSNGKSY